MKLKYIILFLSILSCQPKNEALETALKLAGNNRGELEKVLDHYSQDPADSLKLKAAKFLIENMPGHYTLEGDLINEYRAKIDADSAISYFDRKALDISFCHIERIRNLSHKVEDIEQIKADFLIRHIDLSLENLYKYSWLEDLPFNIFLEYILPYRFENERLDLWLDSLCISPNALKEFYYKDNQKYSVSNLGTNLVTEGNEEYIRFDVLQKLFKQDIYSDCQHIALKENFISRISNFPSTIDFFPHYANRNGFHYWSVIISPEFKKTEIRSFFDWKAAKVFRKTYSRNDISFPDKNEYIPELFQNPFYKDVSNEYMCTANIIIHPRGKIQKTIRHVYLCVFNNLKWTPVAIGNIKNSKVKFKNMGKNIIYLPAYYEKTEIKPLNYPFILTLKGEIKYLIPDTCTRQEIRIKRKYPYDGTLYYYNKHLKNIIIEAAHHSNFYHADTLLSTMDDSVVYVQGNINTGKKYRYWQLSASQPADISEISFFDNLGTILEGNVDSTYIAGLDKNPLTNTFLKKNNKILIDFGHPVNISKVICTERGDGNGIYPDNDYELFYYSAKGWCSLGRKIATDYYITFGNIPQGALLWLHNHTTGVEERIFTCKNGEIRYW